MSDGHLCPLDLGFRIPGSTLLASKDAELEAEVDVDDKRGCGKTRVQWMRGIYP